MGKSYRHQIARRIAARLAPSGAARWLRTCAAWALAFHGVFAPWTAAPLYAQNPDRMTLGVTPTSNVPPDAVADLLASANLAIQGQISLTWTAPQGNAGGFPILNQAVASYSIRYATFSVASLGGDTTTWWNLTAASNVLLQPPNYQPKMPGQLEAYPISGLTPGARYYFAVKSVSQSGVTSPIDSESSSPNQQATAVATKLITSGNTPMRPNGLSASATGGQFTLKWHPVTLDKKGQSVAIDHYVVYRYDLLGSSATLATTVLPNTLSYTDTVGGLTYYYAIAAVTTGGEVSAISDYTDSQGNRYALAPDDINTRVVLPMSIATDLNSERNSLGEDLEIRVTRRQQDEVDVTLRSYFVGVYKAISGIEVPNFAFSQNDMKIQLGLGAMLGAGRLSPTQIQTIQRAAETGAGSIAQIVSVYWFNGGSYIRVSDPVLTSNQALSVNARNVGIYQIRATQLTTQFRLTQGSPYPRVITPNDPAQNNRVFWFFDNPSDDPVTGAIYDIRGAKVRELMVNSQSPTANSLVWDGRDSRGAVVHSGVYLYKISAGKETQTGTVVVAR